MREKKRGQKRETLCAHLQREKKEEKESNDDARSLVDLADECICHRSFFFNALQGFFLFAHLFNFITLLYTVIAFYLVCKEKGDHTILRKSIIHHPSSISFFHHPLICLGLLSRPVLSIYSDPSRAALINLNSSFSQS